MLSIRHASDDAHLGERIMLSPDTAPVCSNCYDPIGCDEDYRMDTYDDSWYVSYLCEGCVTADDIPEDAISVEWDG